MTATLRVIVDDIVAPASAGITRYAEELTRALIATAPMGCEVSGIVSSSPTSDYDRIHTLLPGLADLFKSALARRELQLAWQHGITRLPGTGMVHAPSLLAPLAKHDRVHNVGEQTVVTVHDALPWTRPDALPARQAAWAKAMIKRAHKYADALVVPTHAVAGQLSEVFDFGDRIRVIGGAPSPRIAVPVDADARAAQIGLTERYIFCLGSLESHKAMRAAIRSLASLHDSGLPLVIAGPSIDDSAAIETAVAEEGIPEHRVVCLGRLGDADLAVALSRASVFVYPSLSEGFGLPLVEAFNLGTPVVHSDDPAVMEVSAGAGSAVSTANIEDYPDRLASAIAHIIDDSRLSERMRFAGYDRAAAFRWTDSASQVWQLHADL